MSFISKIKSFFFSSNKENIKDVLEDIIEDNGNSVESIDDGTKKIFKNIIQLNDKCIEDVMIPRADIDSVSSSIKINQLITFINKTKHSRIPVYEENLDKVIGMVHIRDLFEKINKSTKVKRDIKISRTIIRKILFSSPSMRILDLLLKMRSEQIHMSIVVDEFGGTNGLVTIEDLVEEIVGEIKDEHDFEEIDIIKKISKKTYEVSARLTVDEFEKKLGIFFESVDKEDIDTVGGLVFNLIGKIPSRGQVISHKSGLEFTILDADTRKIKRLLVNVK
ncbi:MAG: hemolysin family protein [Alphaproteobacteria bacterium]|tara:strand:- start:920 stop:1753 length:834 start_codon:yes stop_codon:yes gene_type:complete